MRKPKIMSDVFKLTGSDNMTIDNPNYIFKGAKFGDKFVTRDGKEAYFSHTFWSKEDKEEFVILMIPMDIMTEYNQDAPNYITVSLDGSWHRKKHESNNDIVSRYQESVDEDKLDELAIESMNKSIFNDPNKNDCGCDTAYYYGFVAGYRKAKE